MLLIQKENKSANRKRSQHETRPGLMRICTRKRGSRIRWFIIYYDKKFKSNKKVKEF